MNAMEGGGDKAPKDLYIGAINPYALTEAIIGKKLDWSDPQTMTVISETLETEYNELFDMKNNSPIFAGLKLNSKGDAAEPMRKEEFSFPKDSDRVTPSLAGIKQLSDLEKLGIRDITSSNVNHAWLANGKLNVMLEAPKMLNKKLTNTSMPREMFDLVSHVGNPVKAGWTPAGCTWKDVGDFFKDSTQYNDPIQGAVGDCWLIAALAAVAWSDPYRIEHRTRSTGNNDTDHMNQLQFFSKPGGRDAPTANVEVSDSVIVNSISNQVVYCRSREGAEIWPDIYEKAFAKWTNKDNSDTPDITTLNGGDPAKACAQLNDKTPYYYQCSSRSAEELYTLVRANSVSYKTISPMTAWTYASGSMYTGSNIVANHAYTVLGWAFQNGKEYIVLRNPWGVTEPSGLNTYQGLLSFFDVSFWRPINTIGNDGVFALEAPAFKMYFAYLAVAK